MCTLILALSKNSTWQLPLAKSVLDGSMCQQIEIAPVASQILLASCVTIQAAASIRSKALQRGRCVFACIIRKPFVSQILLRTGGKLESSFLDLLVDMPLPVQEALRGIDIWFVPRYAYFTRIAGCETHSGACC